MAELSTLIAIALKTSILMAVVGVAAAALAKASAAYRHLIWTAALALAALMPLAVLLLPPQLFVPVWWPESQTFAAAPVETVTTMAASVPVASGPHALSLLWMVWGAGVIALLLAELSAHFGLMRWRRRAQPLRTPAWQATLARVAQMQTLPRNVTVLESHDVEAPCTWGVMRPVLLLPFAGETWSEAERQHALVHEFAHIRRRDYLSALIARLCRAAHWYNPLVWFAAAQVKRLQEQACDDAVLRHGGRPSEYAQLLLNIAEHSRGPMRAAMGMAGRSHLKGRVLAILGGAQTARVEPSMIMIAGVLFALSAVMFVIATAAAEPAQTSTQAHWASVSATASDRHAIGGRAVVAEPTPDNGPLPMHMAMAVVNSDNDEDTDEPAADEQDMADDSDESDVNVATDDDNDNGQDNDVDVQEDREEHDGNVTVRRMIIPHIPPVPQPPRIVTHNRRMVVHVPPVPAVNTPDIPEQRIVVNVPTGEIRDNGELVMHRQVIRVPRIHGVHVPGQPGRDIVVNVPVVHVVPATPAVPAVPARPARPARPAIPAVPATPAEPAEPATPADEE